MGQQDCEAPAEYVEPLSHLFLRYGQGGVVTEEPGGYSPDEGESPPVPDRVTVKTFYPLDDESDARFGRIDVGVRLMSQLTCMSPLTQRVIEEREWADAWKEHFHPLRVGERLVVAPSWREFAPGEGDVVIRLDPGMAFGTGHHPTTRMCLEEVEALVEPGMEVLDAGCGSGILSIAAALLGARRAFGLDVEEVAVSVAQANAAENGVAGVVSAVVGSLPHPRGEGGGLRPGAGEHLGEGGYRACGGAGVGDQAGGRAGGVRLPTEGRGGGAPGLRGGGWCGGGAAGGGGLGDAAVANAVGAGEWSG